MLLYVRSRTGCGSKRAAQSALAKLVAKVGAGRVVAGHPITLGELLDRWLDDVQPHRSAYTLRDYRRMAERNIKPQLGSVRLAKLNAGQLNGFYRALKERGLSDASVRRHHALRHPALGRAVKWGHIEGRSPVVPLMIDLLRPRRNLDVRPRQ